MKAINISEDMNPQAREPFRWIADRTDPRIEWQCLSTVQLPRLNRLQKPYLARYLTALRAVWRARRGQADLLVTHGTLMAAWVGLFKRLLGVRTPHLAWGFTLPHWERWGWPRRLVVRLGVRNVDRFVMFSTIETRTYPRLLDLPADRFRMVVWSVDRPPVDEQAPPLVTGRYLAAIGREGRDYATLVEAVRGLPEVRLALVAAPDNLAGIDLPDNVQVFTNIPYDQAMNIAWHSAFMVLPLLSDTIPCGHGSLLSQFLLGKATIVTDSQAMEGYSFPGENVLTYRVGDPASLRERIQRLWNDPELARRLAANALDFARTRCDARYTVDYFHAYLREKGLLRDAGGSDDAPAALTAQGAS